LDYVQNAQHCDHDWDEQECKINNAAGKEGSGELFLHLEGFVSDKSSGFTNGAAESVVE
jgi:hypothetical protein